MSTPKATVPAKSIPATTALTATHPIITLEVNLDLQESAIKILILQTGMFCRNVEIGAQLCGPINWRKNGNRPAELSLKVYGLSQ